MAVRYDKKTKDEVVDFVRAYNEENGRGGQSAAVEKFSINPVTIKNWLTSAGVSTPGKAGKKRKGNTSPNRKAAAQKVSSTLDVLKRMSKLQEEMASLHAEYDRLKQQL
ncbi:MAG: hypothetical protein CMO55_23315 [Verrucomicrobiales bacterium]|nr:hypothetical protein [Verrucomicrobiales bacterium]